MRRRESPESSLDLLLDTICNMFGMIIFIAVLAAVLASARGARQISSAQAGPIQDATDLATLKATIAALEDDNDENFTGSLDSATAALLSERSYGRRLQASITTLQEKLDDPDASVSLDQLRADVQTLESELAALHDLRDIKLRTPRQRSLKGRVPVQVVLTRDRLYLVNDWEGWRHTKDPVGQRCTFWSTWNQQAVDIHSSTFTDYDSCGYRTGALKIDREIHLLADGGIAFDSPTAESEISALLDHLVRGKHVVSFRVTPDSFDHFHDARRLVVGQGLEYDVKPVPPLGADMIYRDKIRMGTATGQ
jgi:outer membrane murein-binding lipoprotein Lpp